MTLLCAIRYIVPIKKETRYDASLFFRNKLSTYLASPLMVI